MTEQDLIKKWKPTGLLEVPISLKLELANKLNELHTAYLRSRQSIDDCRHEKLFMPLYVRAYLKGIHIKNLGKYISDLNFSGIDDNESDPEILDKFLEKYK